MKKLFFFVPSAVYYAFIFFLSSRSFKVKPEIPFLDKGVHLVEFALLGLFLSLGYFKNLKSAFVLRAVLTVLSGIILAALDEGHQYFVPGRSTEILDLVADTVGICAGLFVYVYLSRKKMKLLIKTS
jgi:VanZ family protein